MTLDAEPIESIKEILPLAESFCKSVLHHIKPKTYIIEIPVTVKKQFSFDENKIEESYRFISSYQSLLQQECPLIVMAEFAESRPLIRGLIDAEILRMRPMSDNEGNSVNSTFDNDFLYLLNIFQNLIIEYLETEKTLDYHSDKFTRLFKLWTKDQITPTWNKITIPLTGFTSSINQADVIDGFKIRAFSNESKNKFFNETQSIPFSYDKIDFSRITHYLAVDCKQDSNNEEKIKDAQNIITGLRLLQEGLIGARAVFFFKHPRRENNQPTARSMDIFNVTTPDGRYKFLGTDINSLIEIVKHLKKVSEKHHKHLNIALRRFNLSYTRSLPEDRLIDWTISLESTVLAEARDELRYRLALRGSFLLRNICPPEETNKILKKMYDVRSKVVHSGETINDFFKNDTSYNCESFLSQAGNITRKILKEYITLSASGHNVTSVNRPLAEKEKKQ